MLVHLYAIHAWPAKSSKPIDAERQQPNGHTTNGHAIGGGRPRAESQAQDAQEFELHGLISDSDDEDGGKVREPQSQATTPTTPVHLR
jgi:hypothetical protein